MRKVPVVTFADIDAVPLPRSEPREALSDLLEILAQERITIVFCSQRTRAQLEATRQAFGVFHPFICEGGAAAFIPERYFGSDIENTRKVGGYHAIEFGAPYESVIDKLRRAADRLGIGVLGFNDMSVELVARECGLSLLDARLAKLREYGEPFRLLCANPVGERRLIRALESAGLTCRPGAPFHCVGTVASPRSAIDVLTTLYRLAFGTVISMEPHIDAPLTARAWLEGIVQQSEEGRDARSPLHAMRQAR